MSKLETESYPDLDRARLYKEIYDLLYLRIQTEVIKRFFGSKIEKHEGNVDSMLQDPEIWNRWTEGNSSPASKYGFIFDKTILDAIENGEINKVEDVVDMENEFIVHIYEYVWTHDASRRFKERYKEDHPSIDLENYRSEDGYGWVYNLVQAEIMWSKYKSLGGADEMRNIDDWGNSSSLEYDKAMQIMIFLHKDQLLERLNQNFYKLVSQLESIMNNIRDLEATIEMDLHIEHSKRTREHILSALDKVIIDYPQYISNTHHSDIKKRLVQLIEDEIEK